MQPGVIESFFIIFTGAALLATVALFTRQPLLIAYIALGCALGPNALAWIPDSNFINDIGQFGIIFLLFLLGLDLPPSKLKTMLAESIVTALASSVVFFGVGYAVLINFGFTNSEAVIGGLACVFSSTIIGIKLLPTTVLHHRHIGEIVISLLLIQDLLAIFTLLVLAGYGSNDTAYNVLTVVVTFPLVLAGAFLGVKFLIIPLLKKFDAFHEFIFLLAIGWCLAIASASHMSGLSLEIGAVVAGVSLANSPIAQYITDNLRPLRDFFLILFFFSVGAAIDLAILLDVLAPTLLLALILVLLKPLTFRILLTSQGESKPDSWEVGFRLGQGSEFALLLTGVGISQALLDENVAQVLRGAIVITFVVSSYLLIFKYPTPIAVTASLRRD